MGSSIQNKEKESDSRKLLTSSSEILDFILKILQVSFICSFSIGFLVIVIFLGREDLLSQTSSFLGSQSVILSIAGAALIVSFVIFTQLMFLPEFVRNSLNRLGVKYKQDYKWAGAWFVGAAVPIVPFLIHLNYIHSKSSFFVKVVPL